jgi:hypothetical protein
MYFFPVRGIGAFSHIRLPTTRIVKRIWSRMSILGHILLFWEGVPVS